ncbi:MAG: lipid asymmetry maintenance ABC transporter permease subunit MlaE [Pseudomonadota bacterium]
MIDTLVNIGQKTIHLIQLLGRSFFLFVHTVFSFPGLFWRFQLLIRQIYKVGVLSLSIILISGLFVGMVLALQGYNTLVDFGAEESLGVVVALSLVRELGPVVGSLLFAGRAGSALTAEIGLMKATEQLAGMEMMAINPIKQILAPRLLAGIISLPLLVAIFSLIGVYGGSLVGIDLLGVDSGAFWSQIQEKVELSEDIINGMIKSLVFAVVITWIAIFEGYDCTPTAEGVSRATTNTVVYSSLSILGLNFLLTALML